MLSRDEGEDLAVRAYMSEDCSKEWMYSSTSALLSWKGVWSARRSALPVPDNTKVAVIKVCLYDPHINRSRADVAAHYGTS